MGTAVLAACLLLVVLEPAPLAWLRETLFDGYQKLMPRSRGSAPAVIVAIDERALEARGQWPWPRIVAAELLRALAGARPAAIGVDLLFVEPDRSMRGADAALAQAIQGEKIVLGVAGLEYRDRRYPFPPQAAPFRISSARELPLRRFDGHLQSRAEINRAAAGRGLLSVDAPERIIRSVPLVARIGQVVVPALSVELMRIAVGAQALRIDDRGGQQVALSVGETSIPLQADGSMRVYFGPHDPERFVSAEDVLSGQAPPELFRDKFVLVGVTGLGLLDFPATPLGERVPGVEVHAQILEQAFDGAYIRRPTGALWIEAALLALAGAALGAVVPAGRAARSSMLLCAILLGFAAGGVAAFKAGVLLDIAAPSLGSALVAAALFAATLAERDRQQRLLREAQARVAGELEAARRIQMGLLPAPARVFAGEPRFAIEALLEPARSVGGDFYDCFMLDRDRAFFVVADVSGKGLPASLFMALSKALLKSIASRSSEDPGAILTRANEEIARDNPEALFVTAFAAILDARTGELRFCNAGHEPPFARTSGERIERLEHSGGPPLCTLERFEYPSARHVLAGGEWLCVATDGITEAMNARGELYGAARLRRLLQALPFACTPKDTVAAVREDIRRFTAGAEPSDDLTLLCVRWTGGGAFEPTGR